MSSAVPPPAASPLEWAARVPRPGVPGAVGAGVGTQHRPHSVRPCGPALLAVGVADRRPRGGAFHHCEGRLKPGAVPSPAARPLEWAARVLRPGVPGAVGAGVGTQHRPHSVRPSGPALLAVGVAEGRPRWGAFYHCEGRLRSGAVPPPTARPLGGLLGSATVVLWAQVCGRGAQRPSPWLACPVGTACAGVMGCRPRGGWPATVVRGELNP